MVSKNEKDKFIDPNKTFMTATNSEIFKTHGQQIFKTQEAPENNSKPAKRYKEKKDKLPTPNMESPLDDFQIEQLMNKVNINTTFLNMGTNDQNLIELMKGTIEY